MSCNNTRQSRVGIYKSTNGMNGRCRWMNGVAHPSCAFTRLQLLRACVCAWNFFQWMQRACTHTHTYTWDSQEWTWLFFDLSVIKEYKLIIFLGGIYYKREFLPLSEGIKWNTRNLVWSRSHSTRDGGGEKKGETYLNPQFYIPFTTGCKDSRTSPLFFLIFF